MKHQLANLLDIPRLQYPIGKPVRYHENPPVQMEVCREAGQSGSIKLSRLVITIVVAVLICVFSVATSQAVDPQNKGQATVRRSLKTIIIDNYQPYTFMNEKGSPDGFSVEIVKAVATVMDLDLEIRADTWEQATKELERGTIDLLPMMAYSVERDKKFDFSVPYTIAYDAIFHRSGDKSLGSLKDLSGKTVIVMNKDVAHDYILSSGLSETMRLQLVDSLPEALRQLASGKGDAAIMPKLVGIITLRKLNLSNIEPSPSLIDRYTRPFSIAVKEGDQALLERLNQGLSIIKNTGQYDAIYKKWFGALEDPHIPSKSALQLISLAGIFLIAFAAWNVSLKHQVKSRTKDLEAEVAERKLKEEALRESEERYAGLVEGTQDLISRIDSEGRLVFVNRTSGNVFGLSPDECMGRQTFDFVHPEDKARTMEWFRECVASRAAEGSIENRQIAIGGRVHHMQWRSTFHYDGQWNLVSVDGIARDITDRKRAEAEKEKLQAQLRQAMKMEAVGRLAGGIAHDFNNLLTAIIGNVSMAQAKLSTDDPVTGVLMEANKAADRAAALTQQLLAFSRKQIIEPKVLNLNDLIADLNAMLVRLIREDIKIRILPGKDLGVVKVDMGQFQQVLVNLVVNARDAMPGGGKIVIETSNVELDDGYCSMHPYVKPGRFVMVAVSDTGHGMSEEVKAHIFEPFFTTKAKGSGTGLGLATTYGAVKQAGGSIEVYSEVGMGTTFKIYLPRVEGEASKLVRDDQPQKILGGTETVLLVEDEDIVRDMCVRVLDEFGYRVLQASNGKEAIVLSKGHGGRIDLLITDVVMPGMNGSELATQLIPHRPEMRVLFTSGYTEDAIVHHGVLDDDVYFLGKPYSPSALAKKIREVLDKVG